MTESAADDDGRRICLQPLFAAMDRVEQLEEKSRQFKKQGVTSAICRHMRNYAECQGMNGIKRIQLCRQALEALDRRGWDRSFHQRLFHEEYLKSCARIFFKRDGPGAFAISHNRLLEVNSWDSTPQEILVSTPRRFGKTISVSMFAAAMMFSCPNLELSIYSTCKRISQKLLRNIVKFLDVIYLELGVAPHKVLRLNSEEVHVAGSEGHGDVRVINSYPSKIGCIPTPFYVYIFFVFIYLLDPNISTISPKGNMVVDNVLGPVVVAKTVQSDMMIGWCPNLAAVVAVCSMQPSGDSPQISKFV
jgi:hypothetical protein